MSRRSWIKKGTVFGGLILIEESMLESAIPPLGETIEIGFPFYGAILHEGDGKKVKEGLLITVEGAAQRHSKVTVNGIEAKRELTQFSADVVLKGFENEIVAISEGRLGRRSHVIKVLWDQNSFPRYGFEIDDNIFLFRDIAEKRYQSLFDCFYLKGLRDLHKKYGTKFVLNCYFTDDLRFGHSTVFTLPEFPDRYRQEWIDNSDWLRLTFHSWADQPDRAYDSAPVGKLLDDMAKVKEQILRFAGEETYTPPSTIHWGAMAQAYPALAKRGVKALRGHYRRSKDGKWITNHNLDDLRSEYVEHNFLLKDFVSGCIFSQIHIVCNKVSVDQINATLDPLLDNPAGSQILDIETHEQHFWPYYPGYLPDHFERVEKTIHWATQHGYKPVFWNDGFLGNTG